MAPSTRRNSTLAKKIATLQLSLAPLVPLPSGAPHASFPRTLLSFHLLTEDELDSIAHYYHQSTPGPWSNHYPANMNWDKDFLAKKPTRLTKAPATTTTVRAGAGHAKCSSQDEQLFLSNLMTTVSDLRNSVSVPSTSTPTSTSASSSSSSAAVNPYADLTDKERIRIKRRKVGKFIGLVGMETPVEEIAGRIQASLERAVAAGREELKRNEEVALRRRKMA